jgi:leucyl aminopeptidase (aminopeptidase T)
MDIDATKAPRTHATWKKAYDVKELAKLMVELSVQLEVELNVATVNEVFAENKVHILEKELEKANDRIIRLEEAGDMMVQHFYTDEPRSEMWNKAKEAKP